LIQFSYSTLRQGEFSPLNQTLLSLFSVLNAFYDSLLANI